jgi:ubiquinol-cytochrome c reductase cytochrome c1 subunit
MGSGADYLYTYLRGYYRDETTATGWNNLYFPAWACPMCCGNCKASSARSSSTRRPARPDQVVHVFKGFEHHRRAACKAEYDLAVADLVAYLQWMGEPAQNQRVRLGVWVLLFLAVFTLIAWRLNAAFWKDIK